MSYQGGSHKASHHIEWRFLHANSRGVREQQFEPETRVIVKSEPGVPNPYDGRMGEIVSGEAPGDAIGETVYAVLLDFALPGEEPGVPVPIFASELAPTSLPKPENITVSSEPRPNRRIHSVETSLSGGVRARDDEG
ncbi:MAG: hypothetical protein ACYDAR_14210 [Thermomicrobiales bacterium]